jgi:signal transduction histidine kinase/ligand-binding sensor domain-containing protein
MKKSCTIFLAIVLLALNGFSQEPEQMRVIMQFKENPSGVNGMTQDSRGYLWLADGAYGLFRYDGVHLIHYKQNLNNPNALTSGHLECIMAAPDGSIWIGTFQLGLVRFDPVKETFVRYQHDSTNPKSIRSNHIRALTIDSSGVLWVGTRTGVDYYDAAKNEFIHHFTNDPNEKFLETEHVRSMYTDRQGIIWIGCGSPFITELTTGGLFKLNIKKKTINRYIHTSAQNSLADNRVKAIFEDSKGNFWIGTAGDGLHIMNRENGTFVRYPYDPAHPEKLSRPAIGHQINYADDFISSISEDKKGFIWIATFQGGINRYDISAKTIQHYGSNESGIYHLPRNDYWSSLTTRDGLLWFGGWVGNGPNDPLLKINPDPKKMENVLLKTPIYCFAEDKEKNIYMGSANTVIKLNKEGNYDSILHFNKETIINDLKIDDNANLWISNYGGGVMEYNPASKSLQNFRKEQNKGLTNNLITNICIINDDSILVGADPGLYLLDLKQNRFTKYEYINADSSIPVRAIIIKVDSYHNIWIGSDPLGLLRLDLKAKKLVRYKLNDLTEDAVNAIYEGHSKDVYVGFWRNGLRKYNSANDRFELITDAYGLITQETMVSSIHEINDSILWLQTSDGIVKYNVRTRTASNFGKSWGYPANRINSSLFASSDNTYYLGTNSGFVRFSPANLENTGESLITPAFINKLFVNNQLIATQNDYKELIKLRYDQNNLLIDPGFVNFLSDPSEQYVQYMLKGYEDDWRNGENGQQVSYLKVPPGSYVFRLRALDFYGNWNETALPILISPPWYQTWWAYTIYGILFVALVLAVHRYMKARVIHAEREKNRARELAQAKEIEKAYHELRTTQAQLIQSEKMASLGELTAGIAHEIQNPLNFVNNFSEVNTELIEELTMEARNGNVEAVKSIANDIRDNELKINRHGKRADAIVKGMLQHSRMSTGQKELTNINALCDEYLRLTYHGMRAKEQSFKAEIKTDLDSSIPKINIVPQDIGRVLLNLINNAFYAVNEKIKEGVPDYEPVVAIITRMSNNRVEIKVTDNGNGIPKNIADKIFQPFFTTKPTGQGTGLGLSLAYDIVKAHGGEIKVETQEGKGSEFMIWLPV